MDIISRLRNAVIHPVYGIVQGTPVQPFFPNTQTNGVQTRVIDEENEQDEEWEVYSPTPLILPPPIQHNEITSTNDTTEHFIDALRQVMNNSTESTDSELADGITNEFEISSYFTERTEDGWNITIQLDRNVGYISSANACIRYDTEVRSVAVLQVHRNRIVIFIPNELNTEDSCQLIINIGQASRLVNLSFGDSPESPSI